MARVPRTSELLAALDSPGVVSRLGALAAEHGRAAVREARRARKTHPLLPRIYAHSDHAEAFETRAAAAIRWLPRSVALTGLAACAVYGLLEKPPTHLRAAAPSPLHVRQPRWLTLRRCVLPALVHEVGALRVVSVAEALVHAWEEDPDSAFRDALFTALRRGMTSVTEVRQALAYYPRVRARRRLSAFLSHLLDGMHSYLEYRGARTVLNTPDLSGLAYQSKFVIEGNVFYADRFDAKTRTAIEFDGMRWHGTPEARERDRWRDGLFASIGIATVRLASTDVFTRPAWCRVRVRAAIARGTAPP